MADAREPLACQACGRVLPPQRGRGRRRRYCDARCRDAARRMRARLSRRPQRGIVKNNLTAERRNDYVYAIDGVSSMGDPVAIRVGAAARRLMGELDHGGSPGDAVAAARELSDAAEDALQTAVERARAAGQSWREIGDVLGTSRQAAFQRFGHPVDPRTGQAMSRDVPSDAAERAVMMFTWSDEGRWEKIVAEFDQNMRERVNADLLARGWAHMAGMFGRFEGTGEPFARQAGDDTMVDVPLRFEAGDARGIVRFRDGKVAGFAIRPLLLEEPR
jgi:hypothetical protein